jgi:hypothetical protein
MFTLVGIFSEWLASAMGPGFVDVVHGVLIGTSRLERPRDGHRLTDKLFGPRRPIPGFCSYVVIGRAEAEISGVNCCLKGRRRAGRSKSVRLVSLRE